MSYIKKGPETSPVWDSLKAVVDEVCGHFTGICGCSGCPLRGVRDPMGEKVCANYIDDDALLTFKEQILDALDLLEIRHGSGPDEVKTKPPAPGVVTQETFEALVKEIRDASLETLIQRNGNYAPEADKIHNFRAGGAILGRTPAQVALGYMTKHLVSLIDKVERNDFSNRDDLLEKCQDIINYTAIIWVCGNEEART